MPGVAATNCCANWLSRSRLPRVNAQSDAGGSAFSGDWPAPGEHAAVTAPSTAPRAGNARLLAMVASLPGRTAGHPNVWLFLGVDAHRRALCDAVCYRPRSV